MKRIYYASSLLVSLIMLSSILTLLFINKDKLFRIERLTQHSYQSYLNDKLNLIQIVHLDKKHSCNVEKKDKIMLQLGKINYSFHCQFTSFFLQKKPSKEKYIFVDDLYHSLDIEKYKSHIYFIHSLDDIPDSSEQEPKVIMTLNNISGRLNRDFYGIVITEHQFNFTDKKIIGTIYSSYRGNDPNRRNLSFRSSVIHKIEEILSEWHYIPYSNNILQNE